MFFWHEVGYCERMKRLLVQTQLSNITPQGKFVLEADSGWQMVMGRVREMLKLNPELYVDVMCPSLNELSPQCVTEPWDVNPDLWKLYGPEGEKRLRFIDHNILPNALVTRYDFDWSGLAIALDLGMQKIGQAPKYDAVYVNDPMHLRNFKALFHVVGGYQPFFAVHSHFIDDPSCPKFPLEASLWLGQVEASLKADWNFWQCQSSLDIFNRELHKMVLPEIAQQALSKSTPWDDGYSIGEITSPVDMENVRFTEEEWKAKTDGKIVLFFPNRISPSSGDYTNGMKFMFEILPEIRKSRNDFVVVAGNPNLKFSNDELVNMCGANGYVKLVPDTLNRDEYKFVAAHSHIALGLYDKDTYGGTAARECIELGCLPLWLDNYEYSTIAKQAKDYGYIAKPGDFAHIAKMTSVLIQHCRMYGRSSPWVDELRTVVQNRCSYEKTTPEAMKRMGIL